MQVALEDFTDPEHLEIAAPRLCDLQIDLGGRRDFASRASVLDADGREVWVIQVRGSSISMGPFFAILDGKSDVVRVSLAAATVVLMKQDQEVARLPVALDPARITVVGP